MNGQQQVLLLVWGNRAKATAQWQPRNGNRAKATAQWQPRNGNRAMATAQWQPRNMRNSIRRPQVSRRRSAGPRNRCQNLSAVAGPPATIPQPHATVEGRRSMTARVPSVIARTHRPLRGLLQSSPGLTPSSPEFLQPLRGFHQRFLGLPQSLPDAYQSLKEALQSLQIVENKRHGINQPGNGVFYQPRNTRNARNLRRDEFHESLISIFRIFFAVQMPFQTPNS
jgi:hypothetical protein